MFADLPAMPFIMGFYSPNNDAVLSAVKESPVLQREGLTQNEFEKSGNPVPTMEGQSIRLSRTENSTDFSHLLLLCAIFTCERAIWNI